MQRLRKPQPALLAALIVLGLFAHGSRAEAGVSHEAKAEIHIRL